MHMCYLAMHFCLRTKRRQCVVYEGFNIEVNEILFPLHMHINENNDTYLEELKQ